MYILMWNQACQHLDLTLDFPDPKLRNTLLLFLFTRFLALWLQNPEKSEAILSHEQRVAQSSVWHSHHRGLQRGKFNIKYPVWSIRLVVATFEQPSAIVIFLMKPTWKRGFILATVWGCTPSQQVKCVSKRCFKHEGAHIVSSHNTQRDDCGA